MDRTPRLIGIAGLAGLASFVLACAEPAAIRVILVRHGEKATDKANARDPDLSAAGHARAQALAKVVAHAQLAAIFATQFKRTQATVAPSAAATKLPVTRIDASDPGALARAIRAHAGKTVLVAAHSNTVPEIIAALGGPTIAEIDEDDFDNLFVVTVRGGTAELVHLTYGP